MKAAPILATDDGRFTGTAGAGPGSAARTIFLALVPPYQALAAVNVDVGAPPALALPGSTSPPGATARPRHPIMKLYRNRRRRAANRSKSGVVHCLT